MSKTTDEVISYFDRTGDVIMSSDTTGVSYEGEIRNVSYTLRNTHMVTGTAGTTLSVDAGDDIIWEDGGWTISTSNIFGHFPKKVPLYKKVLGL